MLRPHDAEKASHAAHRNHDQPTRQASPAANDKGRTGKSPAEQAADYQLDGTNGQCRAATKAH